MKNLNINIIDRKSAEKWASFADKRQNIVNQVANELTTYVINSIASSSNSGIYTHVTEKMTTKELRQAFDRKVKPILSEVFEWDSKTRTFGKMLENAKGGNSVIAPFKGEPADMEDIKALNKTIRDSKKAEKKAIAEAEAEAVAKDPTTIVDENNSFSAIVSIIDKYAGTWTDAEIEMISNRVNMYHSLIVQPELKVA